MVEQTFIFADHKHIWSQCTCAKEAREKSFVRLAFHNDFSVGKWWNESEVVSTSIHTGCASFPLMILSRHFAVAVKHKRGRECVVGLQFGCHARSDGRNCTTTRPDDVIQQLSCIHDYVIRVGGLGPHDGKFLHKLSFTPFAKDTKHVNDRWRHGTQLIQIIRIQLRG